ncbi:MAG: ABC transporter permease [Chloroflexi bacterium]|nr:ABC transporter permease [Chloroflexota bacterium]
MPLWRFVLRYVSGIGPLAAVAGLGIFLTVTLLAATPLYFSALQNLGLRESLAAEPNLAIQVYVPLVSLRRSDYEEAVRTLDAADDRTIRGFVAGRVTYLRTPFFAFNTPATPDKYPHGLAFGHYLTGMREHVRVVEGSLPLAPTPGAAKTGFQAAVGAQIARQARIEVGHRLRLTRDSPRGPVEVFVDVVGLIEPVDASEKYWAGQGSAHFLPPRVGDQLTVSLFVTEGDIVDEMASAIPGVLGEVSQFLLVNDAALARSSAEEIQTSLVRLETDLTQSGLRASVFSRLLPVTQGYEKRFVYAQVPLLVLVVMSEALVLYLLLLVMSVLGERGEAHRSLLESRGAGLVRTLGLTGSWGLLLSLAALLVSPLVAAATVSLLGYTPAFSGVTGGQPLSLGSLLPGYQWAALGALLAMGALLLPIVFETRISVTARRLRAVGAAVAPWFQRTYADVGLLVVAGALLWQVRGQGQFLKIGEADLGSLGPSFTFDQTALLVPMLTLVAAVLILFRVFPYLSRLTGLAAGIIGPLWAALGFQRMVRSPFAYGRLAGLLLLAMALGTFATTFGGTLDRSARERAFYEVGADVRLDRAGGFSGESLAAIREAYLEVPGLRNASATYRSKARIGAAGAGPEAELLGAEPGTLSQVLWFREDFSPKNLASLLNSVRAKEPVGLAPVLPSGAVAVGVWAKPDVPAGRFYLWVVLKDGSGHYHVYSFGQLDFSGWRFLEIELASAAMPKGLPEPVTIESFQVFETSFGASGGPGSLLLDEARGRLPSGETVTVESFKDVSAWATIPTSATRRDTLSGSRESAEPGGDGSLDFQWGRETLAGVRGVMVGRTPGPLPALVSPSFLAWAGLEVGQEGVVTVQGRVLPIRVAGTVDYFPTLDPGEQGFLIVDGEALLPFINGIEVEKKVWADEVFLSLSGEGAERRAEAVGAVQAREDLRGKAEVQEKLLASALSGTLAVAGWRGLAPAMVVLAALLLVPGYAAHVTSLAKGRTLEAGLFRALGLSPGRHLLQLLVEHALVVLVGCAFGLALGLWLSGTLVPLMQPPEAGARLLPPFILETDWWLLGLVGAVAVGGAAVAIVGLGRSLARAHVPDILRWGQEW